MLKDELIVHPNTPSIQTILNPSMVHPMSAFVARSNHKYNQVLRSKQQQRIIIQQPKMKGQSHKARNSSLPRALQIPRQNIQLESLLVQPKQKRQSLKSQQQQRYLKDEGCSSLVFNQQKPEEDTKSSSKKGGQRKLQTSNDEFIDETLKAAIKLSYHESKKLLSQLKIKNKLEIDKTKIILQNILTGMQHKLEDVTTEKHMKIFGMQIRTFSKFQEQPTVRSKAISQDKERETSKSFNDDNRRKEIFSQQFKRNKSPKKSQQLQQQVQENGNGKTNPNFKFSMTDYSSLSREQLFQMKLISYHHFLFLVSSQSQFYTQPINQMIELKFRIGRGNNSLLLKEAFKNRWWWNLVGMEVEQQDLNFIWTQIKINEYMQQQQMSINSESQLNYNLSQLTIEIKQKKSNQQTTQQNSQKKQSEKYGKFSDPIHKLMNSQTATELGQLDKSIQAYIKYSEKNNLRLITCENIKIHNHIEKNHHLGNKKALYYNMKRYYELTNQDLFKHLPVTFHIQRGTKDKTYTQFIEYYKSLGRKNSIWIVKPGEFTNRGNGITVCSSLGEIHKIICKKQTHPNGKQQTYLIQKYIEKPLLYNKRKFDIRCFFLITQLNHIMRAYWYEEGYIRTSSEEYDLKDTYNQYIHLTNDAIQKYADQYGKYENGNKLSFVEFQRYLEMWHSNERIDFYKDIYPQLRQIATNAIKSVYQKMEPYKREHNFEVFGLDFMIDEKFQPWLIEINTNPCLELSCPLLGRIIPAMVENSLRLSVDTIVPPPDSCIWPPCKKHLIFYDNVLENNRFQLIFDDREDAKELSQLYQNQQLNDPVDDMDEEEEEYKSDDD